MMRRILELVQQHVNEHPHHAANALAVVTGGSFLEAHWFHVLSDLSRVGANIVSIATGIGAVAFYGHSIVRRCVESRRARSKT